ncbi:hypothetical protein ACFPRL_27260 [Pseudoclavibacter helvolus]
MLVWSGRDDGGHADAVSVELLAEGPCSSEVRAECARDAGSYGPCLLVLAGVDAGCVRHVSIMSRCLTYVKTRDTLDA